MSNWEESRNIIEIITHVQPVCGLQGATWIAMGLWPEEIRDLKKFSRSRDDALRQLNVELLQDPRVEVDEAGARMFYHKRRTRRAERVICDDDRGDHAEEEGSHASSLEG
jgi:hypothetical protein